MLTKVVSGLLIEDAGKINYKGIRLLLENLSNGIDFTEQERISLYNQIVSMLKPKLNYLSEVDEMIAVVKLLPIQYSAYLLAEIKAHFEGLNVSGDFAEDVVNQILSQLP